MKFSKEEISLCKQVAEKYRKDIGEGDWVVHVDSGHPTLVRDKESIPYLNNVFQLPLWTISDCLEFFDEREIEIAINHFEEGGWRVQLWKKHLQAFYSDYSCEDRTEKKTPLEACLKAVLAVLEEK